MKMINHIALFAFLLFLSACHGAEQKIVEKRSFGNEQLDHYFFAVKGWYINRNCPALTTDKSKAFRFYFKHIGQSLKRSQDASLLSDIRAEAKSIAFSDQGSRCDNKNRTIVRNAFDTAKKLNASLKNPSFKKKIYSSKELLHQYNVATRGMKIARKCDMVLSADIKGRYQVMYQRITEKLSQEKPYRVSSIRNEHFNINCKNQTQALSVLTSLTALDNLAKILDNETSYNLAN